jgi:NADP-dependent 3-hydroxy acid dehydrogenase YdfG
MKDKIVVITGASRGLGKTLAEMLREKGARLVIGARNKEELDALAKKIDALPVVMDVTKEKDVQKLSLKAVKKFGRIDIWINNAGVWPPKAPLENVDMKLAHQVFEVNFFGPAYGSRAALIQMKKQGSGTIVNIISTAALLPRPEQTIYAASKHATKGFTDSLRDEVKNTPLKIIAIYPGGFQSHLFDKAKPLNFNEYMTTEEVAEKIIGNLLKAEPLPELILKRPGQ